MWAKLEIIHNMYKNYLNRPGPHPRPPREYPEPISMKSLEGIFSSCGDFEYRRIDVGLGGNLFVWVCWVDGLVNGTELAKTVLRPLTQTLRTAGLKTGRECMDRILAGGVYSYSVKERTDMDSLVVDLNHGHCAIIFDGEGAGLSFELRSSMTRSISEPSLEKSLKGAKDSFVETLRVNTALVRRRLCSPKLKLVESSVGRKSQTRVAIMFVDGIAAPELVEELARRLDSLDVEALSATGVLEEYIVDCPRSPFPQLIHTERPDRFAMYLLEGRAGLLVDGLPMGLVLPVSFAEFMKVTGDSSNHFLVATSLTILRYMALIMSLFLPAAYVAVAMYHQEMIPTRLLLSVIEAKQHVPFSTAFEVLGMITAFSLLQEAGLRLPNPIGDTVSIIGALIVGQSAVEAQVVSPIAIIVVALSGISCYTLPSQDMGAAVRLCRFMLLLAAIAAGLYGVALLSCVLILLLADMDSFGLNYTSPLSSGRPWGLFRLLIKIPKDKNKFRDPLLRTPDRRRQK